MNKFDLETLVRSNIQKLKPYASARDEFSGSANIFLDANENSIGSVSDINRNRYPDPHQRILKIAFAEYKKISPDQIFFGNGSDEAIDLVFRIFCEPKQDKVILLPPTYGMYEVCAEINEVQIIKVPLLEGFKIDVKSVLSSIDDKVKLIFICSPNNPSGNIFEEEDIIEILINFKGIVIIDEAYCDFTNKPSWICKIEKFQNLLVFQTFSKAWGLAGIRLGVAMANLHIIELFDKVKPPYNVNAISQELALKSLRNYKQKDEMVQSLINERNKLSKEMLKFSFIQKIYPSDANFFLVKTSAPKELYSYLVDNGIVVRDRSNQYLCNGCLRITVGTSEENNKLIAALESYKSKS